MKTKIGPVKGQKRILITLTIIALVFFTASGATAQCTNINAPKTMAWVNSIIASALGDDNACRLGAPDRDSFATSAACNIFVGRVMARLYGLTDFKSANNSFLKANEIAALIPTFSDWQELGNAGDQAALSAAAEAGNAGHI